MGHGEYSTGGITQNSLAVSKSPESGAHLGPALLIFLDSSPAPPKAAIVWRGIAPQIPQNAREIRAASHYYLLDGHLVPRLREKESGKRSKTCQNGRRTNSSCLFPAVLFHKSIMPFLKAADRNKASPQPSTILSQSLSRDGLPVRRKRTRQPCGSCVQ